jgi:hypothetical protein
MTDWIAQLGIVFFGLAAVTLSQSPSARLNRFACIFGLLGQPFWIWAIATAEPMQWGMLILSLCYSIAWARGCAFIGFHRARCAGACVSSRRVARV